MSSNKQQHTVTLSEGFTVGDDCIPVRSIEIVTFLNPQGDEEIAVRWQGSNNIVAELGMLEYTKLLLAEERLS